MYMIYSMACTVRILGFIACPRSRRLTCGATTMLGETTTSDIGRAGAIALDVVAGLILSFLDHELDDIHVDGGSEDCLQLLLGRFAQDSLVALIGEEYFESYETRSSGC